ncbi:unnamed protein product [Meloidogyne enterolobii]|uniref:Uncharacterized protein n=1 Tax=Meloidogyne enterolobii TaxID=390850 RepID=A0ACB0XX03_MELEN
MSIPLNPFPSRCRDRQTPPNFAKRPQTLPQTLPPFASSPSSSISPLPLSKFSLIYSLILQQVLSKLPFPPQATLHRQPAPSRANILAKSGSTALAANHAQSPPY